MSIAQSALEVAASVLNRASIVLSKVADTVERLETQLGIEQTEAAEPSAAATSAVAATEEDEKPGRAPWIWVSGETKPYRIQLRDAGGRWSPRRQAWYFINCAQLPEHLQNLPGTEVTVSY